MIPAIIVVLVTIVIGILRFTLPVEGKVNSKDVYKDVAHLFVGGLIGAALMTWEWVSLYSILAVGLTILEVVAFFIRRSK